MENLCQSCAMPMDSEELYGTNADGSRNTDYCGYCYQKGAFTSETTLDEMIEMCVPHLVAANEGMTEDDARNGMRALFPTLKRWRTDAP